VRPNRRRARGFELLREQNLAEINSTARYYRHVKTSAELLSLINSDENKVFGVSFATPAPDSTGVAHILEHSVLCGSRKYPVKEPFVELMKSSSQRHDVSGQDLLPGREPERPGFL
jgi:Zn-dependent M16 (insulinase) family peptidase